MRLPSDAIDGYELRVFVTRVGAPIPNAETARDQATGARRRSLDGLVGFFLGPDGDELDLEPHLLPAEAAVVLTGDRTGRPQVTAPLTDSRLVGGLAFGRSDKQGHRSQTQATEEEDREPCLEVPVSSEVRGILVSGSGSTTLRRPALSLRRCGLPRSVRRDELQRA